MLIVVKKFLDHGINVFKFICVLQIESSLRIFFFFWKNINKFLGEEVIILLNPGESCKGVAVGAKLHNSIDNFCNFLGIF